MDRQGQLHWSQTFPAGKRMAVRHVYRPIYGQWYTPIQPNAPRMRITEKDQQLGGQWCFDQSFNNAELKIFDRLYEAGGKSKASEIDVSNDSVQYVLKTGANWQGAIGRFELQIDKDGADLISTCPIPGLTLQRAPYGFSAVATDYMPVSNLDILFVSSRFLGYPDGSDQRQLQTPASPGAPAKQTIAPGPEVRPRF